MTVVIVVVEPSGFSTVSVVVVVVLPSGSVSMTVVVVVVEPSGFSTVSVVVVDPPEEPPDEGKTILNVADASPA